MLGQTGISLEGGLPANEKIPGSKNCGKPYPGCLKQILTVLNYADQHEIPEADFDCPVPRMQPHFPVLDSGMFDNKSRIEWPIRFCL